MLGPGGLQAAPAITPDPHSCSAVVQHYAETLGGSEADS